MAIKKWNGRTINTEEGYFPKEVVDEMYKRLAEEEKAKKSTKKPAAKGTKK